jgi:hypothetical protein
VAINVPRLDYTLGSCPSILVEPARTNLLLRSEEFDNASWTKQNASITANTTTSPDGTSTADKLIEDTSTGLHSVARIGAIASAGTYTLSVYAKAAERTNIAIGNSSSNHFAIFNLSLGTIVQGSQGTVTNGAISSVDANGYYRISCNITVTAATSITINLVSTGTTTNYTGNGTSGLFIWGAQLELGSNATSYIPTTTATVTRNADVISKTGISSLINSEEGVLFFKISNLQQTVNTANWITLSDSTTNATNYLGLRFDVDGTINYRIIVGGVIQANLTTAAVNQSLSRKIAIKWKVNNFSLYIDGLEIGSDLSGSVFPINTLSALRFNFNGTSNSFFGKLENLIVYPTALTNAQLAQLTTL